MCVCVPVRVCVINWAHLFSPYYKLYTVQYLCFLQDWPSALSIRLLPKITSRARCLVYLQYRPGPVQLLVRGAGGMFKVSWDETAQTVQPALYSTVKVNLPAQGKGNVPVVIDSFCWENVIEKRGGNHVRTQGGCHCIAEWASHYNDAENGWYGFALHLGPEFKFSFVWNSRQYIKLREIILPKAAFYLTWLTFLMFSISLVIRGIGHWILKMTWLHETWTQTWVLNVSERENKRWFQVAAMLQTWLGSDGLLTLKLPVVFGALKTNFNLFMAF